MSRKIDRLLRGEGGNDIFPFFWQHGEDEATLREYMGVIYESNLRAVCVESRPHPDFCGPKWWQDMDVILDEARKRGMKVWILDDSHFPTGFANGAMEAQPQELHRQSIVCTQYAASAGETFTLSGEQIRHPKPFEKTMVEQYMMAAEQPVFDDDRLIALYAVRDGAAEGGAAESGIGVQELDLKPLIEGDTLTWTPDGDPADPPAASRREGEGAAAEVPEAKDPTENISGEEGSCAGSTWTVYAIHVSRNFGVHRQYINMMDETSCRVQIDAVYEPHYAHYAADFGTTIAGFFSDEPELGNGHLYDYEDPFGADVDYPWSAELEAAMQEALGADYEALLPLLWRTDANPSAAAKVRWQYMNAVSRLVQKDFSEQIGGWCRAHGVQYIGHLIEDNNHHSRTGCSLGHYFRGLSGQDMAGIDNIGGQVLPQQEDVSYNYGIFRRRDGEFYHYTMGKLAASAAAIEPRKHGNAMCEIFGNYGWSEGVRLERYLADHFMVRGVNHFVPHAYSPAPYPDPDCPPHFYAHGHNPQYRHFGALMAYMNRVCELITGGRHIAQAAVIYSAEGDWTSSHEGGDSGYMNCDPVVRALYDAQIDCDILPQDVFAEPSAYSAGIGDGVLRVNTQEYRMIFVPKTQFITKEFAEAIPKLTAAGVPVYFAGAAPVGICNTGIYAAMDDRELVDRAVQAAPVLTLEEIRAKAREAGLETVKIAPADDRVRCLHYVHEDGTQLYYLVNEGAAVYEGAVRIPGAGGAGRGGMYAYDAWNNAVYDVDVKEDALAVVLEPLKSLMIVLDPDAAAPANAEGTAPADEILRGRITTGQDVVFTGPWKRSICAAAAYPFFEGEKAVALPDNLETEEPLFSGYVRYENRFAADEGDILTLEIEDAQEGVEVFVNGVSLGLQVSPAFCYDLTGHFTSGTNELRIEVATTLERERSADPDPYGRKPEPTSRSGITGKVRLVKSSSAQ